MEARAVKDIVQELYELAETLRDSNGLLTSGALLIQQAARIIETQPRIESERFLAHYNAALTGLLARSEADYICVTNNATQLARMSLHVRQDL